MFLEKEQAYTALQTHFQKRLHMAEPLARHSSFGVGGAADIWLTLETRDELTKLAGLCAQRHWPLLLIGSGSNILFADAGVDGIVARMGFHDYHIEEQPNGEAMLYVDAGVQWGQLLHNLVPLGWGGLEFGVGIPGTMGAGIVSNAGAHNRDLGQALTWIEVLDARGCNYADEDTWTQPIIRRYEHDELDLGYRHSRFRVQHSASITDDSQVIIPPRGMIEPAEIVTTLGLRIQREDPKHLCALLDKNKQQRKQTDPSSHHAGAIFKDIPEHSAHELIQQAGLSGKRYGQAQISEQNANYILNLGGATTRDILALIKETHQGVLQRHGIDLTLNIELRGEWDMQENTVQENTVLDKDHSIL